MSTPRFLTSGQCKQIANEFGTPAYVYDEATLKKAAREVLDFGGPYGFTGRYAMKACPNGAILTLFRDWGLHFDVSSGYEVLRAIQVGIPAEKISLSSQEYPENIGELVNLGITVNACSLKQVESFGQAFPGGRLGLRVNPGVGSGGTLKTNVGGPSSSFGIWHELLDQVEVLTSKHALEVFRIHSHIGSGSDPDVWVKAADLTLNQVRRFPGVTHLNLGGGFKVGRMPGEDSTDLGVVGPPVKMALEAFAAETGRKLHLEIEPGSYLTANAGCLLATVQDKTNTGDNGHVFLKLDTGMTDILRPTLYAAQQPMAVVPVSNEPASEEESVIVVGHCCESGDLLTPDESDPGLLKERRLTKAEIGDLFVIDGAGAYCAAMPAKNYNSFPEIPELLVRESGECVLIRKRQTLEQVFQNEVPLI
ncbi:MAG: diaminopimelate decarboxylase [Verrucomicrobia bacterium]|nr:diaminopimelate decarboxylase [Verrucomicrobiota bacterium]